MTAICRVLRSFLTEVWEKVVNSWLLDTVWFVAEELRERKRKELPLRCPAASRVMSCGIASRYVSLHHFLMPVEHVALLRVM